LPNAFLFLKGEQTRAKNRRKLNQVQMFMQPIPVFAADRDAAIDGHIFVVAFLWKAQFGVFHYNRTFPHNVFDLVEVDDKRPMDPQKVFMMDFLFNGL
jgi:hypothetical protein